MPAIAAGTQREPALRRKICPRLSLLPVVLAPLLLTASVALASAATAPAGLQDLAVLEAAVERHLRRQLTAAPADGRWQIAVRPIDRRLRLHDCEDEPQLIPRNRKTIGRVIVTASCSSPRWTVHVASTVELFAEVLVAAQPIARGTTIEAAHLSRQERLLNRMSGRESIDMSALIGLTARRNLRVGQVVRQADLVRPIVVARGEQIDLRGGSGNVFVTVPVIALGNGHEGEQVEVRNEATDRVIRAYVIGPGLVATRRAPAGDNRQSRHRRTVPAAATTSRLRSTTDTHPGRVATAPPEPAKPAIPSELAAMQIRPLFQIPPQADEGPSVPAEAPD